MRCPKECHAVSYGWKNDCARRRAYWPQRSTHRRACCCELCSCYRCDGSRRKCARLEADDGLPHRSHKRLQFGVLARHLCEFLKVNVCLFRRCENFWSWLIDKPALRGLCKSSLELTVNQLWLSFFDFVGCLSSQCFSVIINRLWRYAYFLRYLLAVLRVLLLM